MNNLKYTFVLGALFSLSPVQAEESVKIESSQLTFLDVQQDSVPKKSFMTKFLDYFNDANKNKGHKKFDFSIIGGPHYSTDTKLGLGLVAAGLYRMDRSDLTLPPSNVSLFSDISTVGFYLLGIRGTNIFPKDRYRMDYTIHFYSFPCYYWGMGYENGNASENKSEMDRWQMQIKSNFLFRVSNHFYVGPMASFDYIRASDLERPDLLEGMDAKTTSLGVGFALVYDSRDVLTNPHTGYYVNVSQCFRPRFLGNDYAFSTTELRASTYKSVWKGGLLAAEIRTQFNFGNPSWGMMAKLGSSGSMRGYYEGRYRDKHKMEGQLELRQHIWKRNGVVAWVGLGTVFSKFSALRTDELLPNYGIGYRWEFKKNVNVRLDYGFGKSGQSGFMFNINEAF